MAIYRGGNVINNIYVADEKYSSQNVTTTPHLAYYKNGRAQKALGIK